jgi:Icc-related predicted phosphoesterase
MCLDLLLHWIPWWAHKADFEEEMEQYMINMQEGVDIVVTHSPPHGVGDLNMNKSHCGSKAVRKCVEKQNPEVHVFVHIHEGRGLYKTNRVSML